MTRLPNRSRTHAPVPLRDRRPGRVRRLRRHLAASVLPAFLAPALLTSANALAAAAPAPSVSAAARLLDQATFGPTVDSIAHVQQVGLEGYLNEQFALPVSTVPETPLPPFPSYCTSANACNDLAWWKNILTGKDQLRQRTAFALSHLFVVSFNSAAGADFPDYQNVLARDAFTNYLTLMKDVTLTSAMGSYLNMGNSGRPVGAAIANENFAREMMQLFTLGPNRLNLNGTLRLDRDRQPVPTFTEAQVKAFALAYTGWTYPSPLAATQNTLNKSDRSHRGPMVAINSEHDPSAKALLNGTVLPAGQSAQQDLAGALLSIFNDDNIAPFVSRSLIQHLVTSNPSPAYIARVASVFLHNAAGVRGDMKSILTAILLDPEARAGDTNTRSQGGHLREPLLWLANVYRGLDAYPVSPGLSAYVTLSIKASHLNEAPFHAPSVFDFYSPNYLAPGTSQFGPEFMLEDGAGVVQRASYADLITNNQILPGLRVDLSNTSTWGTLAANPASLVDALAVVFMHGQMPADMRATIISAVGAVKSPAQRARFAVFLIVTSPQYLIVH